MTTNSRPMPACATRSRDGDFISDLQPGKLAENSLPLLRPAPRPRRRRIKSDTRIRVELPVTLVAHVVLDKRRSLSRAQLELQRQEIIRVTDAGVIVIQYQTDFLNRKTRGNSIGVQRDP